MMANEIFIVNFNILFEVPLFDKEKTD